MGANEVRTAVRTWSRRARLVLTLAASTLGVLVVGIGLISAGRKARAAGSPGELIPGLGVEYVLLPEAGLAFVGTALVYLAWVESPLSW
ncbi:hypothetical protein [Halostella litorea]|uniref:hypothetical protein n=1 Tax=Halostella litorea TaxID=2528831 RepID=UPI001092A936|nr:hypothetical protein [Halostella litorea]